MHLLNDAQGLLNHRKVRKAEEVHLKKAKLLNLRTRILRRKRAFSRNFKRHELHEIIWRNHHATSVHAMATNRALKPHCEVNYLFCGRIRLIFLLQIRLIHDSVFELHMVAHHWIWYEFREPIRLSIRHIQDACHIAHSVLRHHLTKGHNVTHAAFAVLLCTIFNHLVAAVILNISIDIRHRNTVRVQEALEEQMVFERIEIGNVNCVRKQRTCRRTTTRSINNSLVFTPVNEVLNNQEVAVITHLVDRLEFVIDTLQNLLRKQFANLWNRRLIRLLLRHITITLSQAAEHELIKVFLLSLASINRELRNKNTPEINRHVAALSNFFRIENRLRASLLPTRD